MVHVREFHDGVVAAFEAKLKQYEDIKIDNFIVMPAARYWMVEPVTDEKIKLMGECWNRVGEMTKDARGAAHLPPRVLLRAPPS